MMVKAYIDAAYGVHQDSSKSHTGCAIVLGESAKLKIVTKSSTEARCEQWRIISSNNCWRHEWHVILENICLKSEFDRAAIELEQSPYVEVVGLAKLKRYFARSYFRFHRRSCLLCHPRYRARRLDSLLSGRDSKIKKSVSRK
jgi:hypothetical protein